jgi:hypothetical protein
LIEFRSDCLITGPGFEFEYHSASTAIQKPEQLNTFSVYPNPFKDQFTIFSGKKINADYSVSLFNVNGKRLFFGEWKKENPQFQLNGLNMEKGIYFLKIGNRNFLETFKLIKI